MTFFAFNKTKFFLLHKNIWEGFRFDVERYKCYVSSRIFCRDVPRKPRPLETVS
jgi:hypothetical protein